MFGAKRSARRSWRRRNKIVDARNRANASSRPNRFGPVERNCMTKRRSIRPRRRSPPRPNNFTRRSILRSKASIVHRHRAPVSSRPNQSRIVCRRVTGMSSAKLPGRIVERRQHAKGQLKGEAYSSSSIDNFIPHQRHRPIALYAKREEKRNGRDGLETEHYLHLVRAFAARIDVASFYTAKISLTCNMAKRLISFLLPAEQKSQTLNETQSIESPINSGSRQIQATIEIIIDVYEMNQHLISVFNNFTSQTVLEAWLFRLVSIHAGR